MPFLLQLIKTCFPEDDIAGREHLVKEAFEKLPPDIKTVIEYRYIKNRALKEIPALIGKSISTVRHRHNYGLFLMEEYIKKHASP